MNDRPGCLAGLLKLLALSWFFDWLQDNFGFGRGCAGFGCGIIFLIIFLAIACSILLGTDWLRLTMSLPPPVI
jgi:hypothetical protein